MSDVTLPFGVPRAAAPSSGSRRSALYCDVFSVAYLLMLCGAVYALFSTTTTSGWVTAKAGTSSIYTGLWLGLYGVLLFYLRRELINPINLFGRNRLFGLFLASAVLSYGFSPPASQLVATKLFMFAMTLLFGLHMARNFTVERLLSLFVTLSAFVLVVHWLIYPVQSHFAYDHMERATLLGLKPYGGLFAHKNLAGTFFGLSFLASYGRALAGPRRWRFVFLTSGHAVALVVAGAASALLCAVIGAMAMTGVALYARRSKLLPFYFIGLALVAVLVIGVGTSSILHAVGRDAGMSGRWRVFAVWPNYFGQHPLFGWGYSNFFTGDWNEPAEGLRTLTPYHARFFTFESAYLELLIDFGLIGAGLFFAMMATGVRNAFRLALRSGVLFAQVPLGWLVFIAVMSVSDSGLRIHNLVTASVVAWAYFGLNVRTRAGPLTMTPMWRPIWTPS
jgi:exopolysaccharide production protein ExoQ